MIFYSNTTTTRLEGRAHALGLADFRVVKAEGNAAGVFFCVRRDDKPQNPWIALGWTVAEAQAAIERIAAG